MRPFATLKKETIRCVRCGSIEEAAALYFVDDSLRLALDRPWGLVSKRGKEDKAIRSLRFLCPQCMETGDGHGLHS